MFTFMYLHIVYDIQYTLFSPLEGGVKKLCIIVTFKREAKFLRKDFPRKAISVLVILSNYNIIFKYVVIFFKLYISLLNYV